MASISRRSLLLTTGIVMSGGLSLLRPAFASNHFETELARNQPDLGITDMFVFANPAKDHTVVIINVNSTPEEGTDSPYHRGALYNIHLSKDDTYTSGMTLSFSFDGPAGRAYLLDQPNAEIGATGDEIGSVTLGQEATFENGIRVWAGIAQDPFFGNATGLGVFQAQQSEGVYDPDVWKNATGDNLFVGRKCAPIVVEVPNAMIGDQEVRVFATSAFQENDTWEQAQYYGLPLVAHTMFFESEKIRSAFDKTRPTTQDEFRGIMAARIARSVAFAESREEPFVYADETIKIFVPDVQRYKPGSDAVFTADKRNGRPLDADAMSAILTLLIGEPTDQSIENPELYNLEKFPYILPVSAE